MEIKGNQIYADEGMLIRRIGQGTGVTKCFLLPNETEKDFEEAESFPEEQTSDKPSMENQMATFSRMMTRTMTTIPDEAAVEMPDCFDEWKDLIGETLEKGRIISHNGKTYRLQQQHLVQKHFVPGAQGMESIYAVIDKKHAGTLEDPIPYSGNMELENGKYYTQGGIKYKCYRDTGIPVYAKLEDLVGQYVEVVS